MKDQDLEHLAAIVRDTDDAGIVIPDKTLEEVSAVSNGGAESIHGESTLEALRLSAKRLAEVQRLAHLGSWELDLVTNHGTASLELLHIFGLEPPEFEVGFTAQTFIDILHPDDQEWVQQAHAKAVAQGSSLNYETRIVRPDGTVRYLHALGEIIIDDAGQPVRMIGTSQDITERKLAELALQNSEKRFRALVEHNAEAIVLANSEGVVVYASPSASEILGTPHDELVGMSGFNALHPDDKARTLQMLGELLQKPGTSAFFEARFRHRDGSWRWIEGTGTNLFEEPSVQALVTNYRDITKRKDAEEALRGSVEKFRAIFENTLDAVFITTDGGKFVDVNPAACKLLGLSPEELQGRSYSEFQNVNATIGLEQLQDQIAQRGEASGDLQIVSAKGEIRDVEYFTKMNFIPGYHLSVAHDLTERRRGEHAKIARDVADHANQAKSEFLSRMSHELRTPLNSILGFGQLLQMNAITPDEQEMVGYILKGGEHLLRLINEVLDIASIEAGKLTFSMEPVFVRDTIQESLDLVRPIASVRHIEVKSDLDWMDNCHVRADPQRLKQVLLNLLANAIKYNHEGGMVTVSCSELGYQLDEAQSRSDPQASRGRLRISISDTGPGLTSDKIVRLFTPFDRLGAEQGDVEGTGLGLALSRHLMEAMGGTIGVESQQGEGSTFWVELSAADE